MSETTYPHYDVRLSKDYIYKMQQDRFQIFKSQDLERGCFDVVFEIEGKKLHANKYILTSISNPLDVMLSDRWSKKDEAVKIEKYTFEQFFEFVSFLYTGKCDLSESDALNFVDMAEFYDVPLLKDYCDRYLSSIELKVETLEAMTETAVKYSLSSCLDALKTFVIRHFDEVIKLESFKEFNKFFVEFLATVNRYRIEESDFFAVVYNWAEHQALKQKAVDDKTFNIEKAVKLKLANIVPHIEFFKMNFDFLLDFVIEKGFHLSPAEMRKFFMHSGKNYGSGIFLKKLYLLAEKQGLQKQKMSSDANFNIANSVRADLADVIPRIKFYDFDKNFFNDFVVAMGILTQEEASHVFDTRVEIKNDGQVVTGSFKDVFGILKAVQRKDYGYNRIKQSHTKMQKFFGLKFAHPTGSSVVKKMKGVDWYLCLDNGAVTLKHFTLVKNADYLIAEMRSSEQFHINPDQMTHITASYNNV